MDNSDVLREKLKVLLDEGKKNGQLPSKIERVDGAPMLVVDDKDDDLEPFLRALHYRS